ncbi:MAG: hypothetical protein WCA10_15325 [Terracidiphilus sp.]
MFNGLSGFLPVIDANIEGTDFQFNGKLLTDLSYKCPHYALFFRLEVKNALHM